MPRVSKDDRIKARLGRSTRRSSRPDVEGNFKKGRQKTGGRQKGTPNLATRDVKQAILDGLSSYGRDGKGGDGLAGYVFRCAEDSRIGAMLLRVVLPHQIKERIEEPTEPADTVYETIGELEASLRECGIPETTIKLCLYGPVAEADYKVVDNSESEGDTTCVGSRKPDGGS